MDALVLDRAEVRISGRRVLGPLSLTIGPGECWAVLGPNGSGKTTLLTLAGARRQPSSGRVAVLGCWLGETPVRDLWPRIGHVSHALADRIDPSFAVEQVVLTGRSSALVPFFDDFEEDDLAEVDALLREAGCEQIARNRFGDCSLGERQRVLIARARFGDHEMLLLDEPAAGLDIPGREALLEATERACRDGATVLLSTHHLEEIPPSATHVLMLHDGRAVASGPVEDALSSRAFERTFGVRMSVGLEAGRWHAVPGRGF
jgi:iron complex transport system ATP-binding protein